MFSSRLLLLEPRASPAFSSLTSPRTENDYQARSLASGSFGDQPRLLLPALLHEVTGQAPTDDDAERRSLAGYTTHPPLKIRNRYVNVDVGLWCDEVPLLQDSTLIARADQQAQQNVEAETECRSSSNEDTAIQKDSVTFPQHVTGAGCQTDESSSALRTTTPATKTESGEESFQAQSGGGNDEDEDNNQCNNNTGPATQQMWLQQMLSPEAAEVRAAIGAIALTLPASEALKKAAGEGEAFDSDLQGGRHYRWKLDDEYMSLVSAVHSLRLAVENESFTGYSNNEKNIDFGFRSRELGAVIILQGPIPLSSSKEMSSSGRQGLDIEPRSPTIPGSGSDNHQLEFKPADDLVESIEEQLLNVEPSPIFGWDVVYWDGRVQDGMSPRGLSVSETRTSGRRDNDGEMKSVKEEKTPRLNAYGEKRGIDRLREVLETVEWTTNLFQAEKDGGTHSELSSDEERHNADGFADLQHELSDQTLLSQSMPKFNTSVEDHDKNNTDDQTRPLLQKARGLESETTPAKSPHIPPSDQPQQHQSYPTSPNPNFFESSPERLQQQQSSSPPSQRPPSQPSLSSPSSSSASQFRHPSSNGNKKISQEDESGEVLEEEEEEEESIQVEQLQHFLNQAVAIRESTHLSPAQREKCAHSLVGRVMRGVGERKT